MYYKSNFQAAREEEKKLTKTERSLATVQMFLYSKYLLRIEDFRSQNAECLSSLQSNIRRITEVSLVKMANQWVEVDCGLSRGLKGKVLTLQLTERYGGNTPLEIASIEVFGWGRTCGSEDPTI